MEDSKKFIAKLLKRLIEKGNIKQYHIFLQKYHESDIAEAIEELPYELQLQFFTKIKPEKSVDILEQMKLGNQMQLISDFKTELAAEFISEMDSDDAADLIEELLEEDEDKAHDILEALPIDEASEIEQLMRYQEDSAGSLMTSEFVAIPENLTVSKALSLIKKQKLPDSEASFYIFVINEKGVLVGFTTLRDLLISADNTKVNSIRNDYPISVNLNLDQEEVARLFRKYDVSVMPVVNNFDQLMGIITIDDIVDVVVEEATEDIYKLSGTGDIEEEKLLSGKIVFSLQSRIPWLILTLLGGFIASLLINYYSTHFKANYFSLALSLSFVPLLMGIGGNVANQSATIIVRGLSTGFVKGNHPFRYILRELSVGLFIGLIIALIVLIFNFLIGHPLIFNLIVFVSMMINIITATLIGSSLPIIFNKMNIDPAVASAPFISTTLDIIGQIIYYTLTISLIFILL